MQIVNVGCGMRPTPGALNIDNSMSVALGRRPTLCNACAALRLLPPDSLDYARFCQAHGITRMSCTKLKLLDDSVDVLYSSHMIEHLLRAHAALFLEEARRVNTLILGQAAQFTDRVKKGAKDENIIALIVAGGDT